MGSCLSTLCILHGNPLLEYPVGLLRVEKPWGNVKICNVSVDPGCKGIQSSLAEAEKMAENIRILLVYWNIYLANKSMSILEIGGELQESDP